MYIYIYIYISKKSQTVQTSSLFMPCVIYIYNCCRDCRLMFLVYESL